jgi:tRNA-2-methylthio-N6-dimethylallyladenosine synthase
VQSGSDRVLAAMNRRYDRATYVDTLSRLRAARPGIAITTDLIVAFPTETRDDFAETLALMREVRFTDSFSFKYSERPHTPAARRGLGELEPGEAQARLAEVQSLQTELTLAAHRDRVGDRVDVLVDGDSRRAGATHTGRDPQNRLVNFRADSDIARGAYAVVDIAGYTPHSLLGQVATSAG